jgi:hypothetical protein
VYISVRLGEDIPMDEKERELVDARKFYFFFAYFVCCILLLVLSFKSPPPKGGPLDFVATTYVGVCILSAIIAGAGESINEFIERNGYRRFPVFAAGIIWFFATLVLMLFAWVVVQNGRMLFSPLTLWYEPAVGWGIAILTSSLCWVAKRIVATVWLS